VGDLYEFPRSAGRAGAALRRGPARELHSVHHRFHEQEGPLAAFYPRTLDPESTVRMRMSIRPYACKTCQRPVYPVNRILYGWDGFVHDCEGGNDAG
jgi:hypothetical protein